MKLSIIDSISELQKQIQSISDVDTLLDIVNQQIPKYLDAEYCCISLYDNMTQEIYYCKGCEKLKKHKATFLRTKKGTGIIGQVAQNLKPIRIADAQNDPRFAKEIDAQGNLIARSLLAVPMISRTNLIGVLVVINKKRKQVFSENHEKMLSVFAGLTATCIDNIRLSEENMSQNQLTDLGQSIASSAHSLKNILNNMDGGSYIVERGVAAKNMGHVNKGWEILRRNSQRMRDMVLDMLMFSHPRKPEYIPSDINKICRDLYELVKENARERNVEINLELDEHLDLVCIDPKGIYRCILNLVSNAVDACAKKGGLVIISTHFLKNKDLEIKITDNGPGISKHNINHIFDVFYTTKGSHGTGLGLSVTKKIIAEHNGAIEVNSKLKKGTTFTITIPKHHECE